MTKKYRKKPVVIEAIQFTGTGDSLEECAHFIGDENLAGDPETCSVLGIKTLEGVMIVSIGDWIIKGVKGEFYPCKPDIFEATYEPVWYEEGELTGRRKHSLSEIEGGAR